MRAYLSYGSNLATLWGDPRETILAAVAETARTPGITLGQCSSVYRTEAVGAVRQADFANLALEIESELDALALLRSTLALELSFGRVRDIAGGPRTLDVDLLLHGQTVISTAELTLPHPRMHERAFVLVPLAEIAADVMHPVHERSVAELRDELADTVRVERWQAPEQAVS